MKKIVVNPAYNIFRQLSSALEIRDNSEADRDRNLYNAVRHALGIENEKPSEFFIAHPEISEMFVLTAFLEVMQPFSKMIESIFSLCSQTKRGATGGNDLSIRYNSSEDSLKFNTEAFKRYKHIIQKVKMTGVVPKYHSDYIPMYPHILQELIEGRTNLRYFREETTEDLTMESFSSLIDQARIVGEVHITMLDDFISTHRGKDITKEEVQAWFKDHGIEGWYIPETLDRIKSWKSSINAGLQHLSSADYMKIFGQRPLKELSEDVERLRKCLEEISNFGQVVGIKEVIEEWLSLPYWKKRWQVYEIWIYIELQKAIIDAGGRFNLNEDDELILYTGTQASPKGVLPLRDSWVLELWCEYPLTLGQKKPLRLDLAFVLRTPQLRVPLHFIECKQRINVSAQAMASDASKYLPFMPQSTAHLLVNYDSFIDPEFSTKSDKAGRSIKCIGDVRPDEPSLTVFLQLIHNIIPYGSSIYILLDTTGSMHKKIRLVAEHCEGLKTFAQDGDSIRLILYGDHGDQYTVKEEMGITDYTSLVKAILNAPLTDGADDPEALEDALNYVRKQIQDIRCNKAKVIVFADAAAHEVKSCPNDYDFEMELDILRKLGAEITLVACERDFSEIGWNKIKQAYVTSLDSHVWL